MPDGLVVTDGRVLTVVSIGGRGAVEAGFRMPTPARRHQGAHCRPRDVSAASERPVGSGAGACFGSAAFTGRLPVGVHMVACCNYAGGCAIGPSGGAVPPGPGAPCGSVRKAPPTAAPPCNVAVRLRTAPAVGRTEEVSPITAVSARVLSPQDLTGVR
ncbi:hypothetical protein GCM10010515_28310 [Streptomyces fructofermentans]|uniref:Uncharacterized protein n=1 Tax=Streptomyces fructofermentans TaxID=152141 RepID=A0A918KEE8_9ACTN|nr:hypothetical protein GCM10010515_28310 [Streptomyces fructofermentans]